MATKSVLLVIFVTISCFDNSAAFRSFFLLKMISKPISLPRYSAPKLDIARINSKPMFTDPGFYANESVSRYPASIESSGIESELRNSSSTSSSAWTASEPGRVFSGMSLGFIFLLNSFWIIKWVHKNRNAESESGQRSFVYYFFELLFRCAPAALVSSECGSCEALVVLAYYWLTGCVVSC